MMSRENDLIHEFFKLFRYVSFKFEQFGSNRMNEEESECMEAKSVGKLGGLAIFFVTEHRMPEFLHVHPDLVRPSCLKREFHQ